MVVVGDFPRVKRHSQPDLLLDSVRFIVPPKLPRERRGKHLDNRSFEDLGRHEHEISVAGALVLAVEPGYAGFLERPAQREIETSANHQPMRRGPAPVTVTFDIHREYRAVHDQS
ncbi:hypothetical protein AB0J55_12720 [Amycolatopsis sp. NPDC049688]|uniref:hypothetical protein n=1 Tax=Amycolatopsis sp. NPDC049688 TaxID=3154733 RepID=UPI00343A3F34